MKNKFLIVILVIGIAVFAACNGDHSTRVVRDTVGNRYGADTAKVEKSNIDTAKVSSPDNSASGGAKAVKDSSKQKVVPKK
jgi:hypothetical protein